MPRHRKRRNHSQDGKSESPLFLLVFGIVWTLFSSIFVAVPLAGPIAALPQLTWRQVPCVVDRFEIADDRKQDKPFSPELSFRFPWPAAPQAEADATAPPPELTGTRLRTDDSRDTDHAELAKLREKILARPTPVCWVNPADPSQAVLQRGVPYLGSALGMASFGGCFVAIGIGLLVTAARLSRAPDKAMEDTPWLLYPVFGMFGLAGLGIFGALVVPSWTSWFAASSWLETPAEVIWSEVRVHRSGSRTTTQADVFYRYTYGGKEYRSNSDSLFGSPSGSHTAQSIVATLPPGKRTTCFVNPRHPWQAVRDRTIGWRGVLLSLFALPFMAVGFFGLRWVSRRRRGHAPTRPKKEQSSPLQSSAG